MASRSADPKSIRDPKEKVYSALCQFQDPVTLEEIARRIGQKSTRNIRSRLENLEKEGKATKVQDNPPSWISTAAVAKSTPKETRVRQSYPKSAMNSQRYQESLDKKAVVPPASAINSQRYQESLEKKASASPTKQETTAGIHKENRSFSQKSTQNPPSLSHTPDKPQLLPSFPLRRHQSDSNVKRRSHSLDRFQESDPGKRTPTGKSPSALSSQLDKLGLHTRVSAKDIEIDESTRVSALPYKFIEVAGLLVIGPALHRGWERFAGELGFDLQHISVFKIQSNPVKAVIEEWQTQRTATFGKFIEVMRKMDRFDVITDLKSNLGFQLSSAMAKRMDVLIPGSRNFLNTS